MWPTTFHLFSMQLPKGIKEASKYFLVLPYTQKKNMQIKCITVIGIQGVKDEKLHYL